MVLSPAPYERGNFVGAQTQRRLRLGAEGKGGRVTMWGVGPHRETKDPLGGELRSADCSTNPEAEFDLGGRRDTKNPV